MARSARFLLTLLVLATSSPAFSVYGADGDLGADTDPGGDLPRIPGLPPIRMPPGGTVQSSQDREDIGGDAERPMSDRRFGATMDPDGGDSHAFDRRRTRAKDLPSMVIGPGGVIKPGATPGQTAAAPKKKVPTAAEKAEIIRKALAPKPPLASARRHTLDDLYVKLAAANDTDEAKGLASLIGTIWMRTSSDTAGLLMTRAVQSIETKNYPLALQLLDRIVELQPNWAEAWNKRASVRYFNGDIDGSMADVEHVLKLEPKHFGALEGMAAMLQRAHLDKRALEIYRRALEIYPHQPDVQKIVDKLALEVEGQGI